MDKFRDDDTLGKIKADSITSSIKIRSTEPVPGMPRVYQVFAAKEIHRLNAQGIESMVSRSPRPARMQISGMADDLERCDREIAAAMKAVLTGSAPIDDGLLWYTDWCQERELILLAADEDADWRRFDPA